ncbi:4-phosphoerythronate dehydrogenase [Aestuariibacter halophilus]|uniref:Erythronate-4-phosphate dehydrogenase n=1 Tax=Fluctibacter halophilus TaxID=226011 RepID=A0ABS8G866_9ALTE|nr:4-phosphoerythronate dehydrogenase [Aestuariibacter halophilus]MCC2616769.1 4-phosphoerythronate dehydrogenase [Aestuariibacter halophilus]
MRILYEDTMPFADALFPKLGDCQVFNHQTITAQDVADADVLLVRSTTRVNEALLHQAKHLQYVATATAGTNHMDINYLQERGIPWGSAAGCNAVAVAEYVISVLLVMAQRQQWDLSSRSVGIIGAGHVGTALSSKLDALGIQYRLCDPPLQAAGDPRPFCHLDAALDCDIVTLHVPLVTAGPHPTEHLIDGQRLRAMGPEQLLINACRGEVMDNAAALACKQRGDGPLLVMDVWENEPDILWPLVQHTELATAHIAGHTLEGKARGTTLLYQQLAQRLGRPVEDPLSTLLPVAQPQKLELESALQGMQAITALVHAVYDVRQDDRAFRTQVQCAEDFIYSRKHYAIRREFSAHRINAGNCALTQALYGLGFAC